jgi:hypothetical protein
MKVIKIFHENAEPIKIEDHDSRNLSEYTKDLSKVLEASNVTILETSSGSVIIRPSRVCSIIVSEVNDHGELLEESITEIETAENEDVITDGE